MIKDGSYDLVFHGKQEIDLDAGQLGPALAEALDWPHVGAATKFELSDNGKTFTARRRVEGAEEVVEVSTPALVTCEKGLCEMRYPSLPNLMKAKRKPVATKASGDVPGFADLIGNVGGAQMNAFAPPPERPPGKVLHGEAEEAVKELVKLLREEAKAI